MWPNQQIPSDLVTFTEEILHEKLHFLYSVNYMCFQRGSPFIYKNILAVPHFFIKIFHLRKS